MYDTAALLTLHVSSSIGTTTRRLQFGIAKIFPYRRKARAQAEAESEDDEDESESEDDEDE